MSFFTNFPCIRLPYMRKRSINASMRAAALSSSESTKSRAGTRPLGSSTYSIVNSLFTSPSVLSSMDYRILAMSRQGQTEDSIAYFGVKPTFVDGRMVEKTRQRLRIQTTEINATALRDVRDQSSRLNRCEA